MNFREVKSLGDLKVAVDDIEATVIGKKGAKYLQEAYARAELTQLQEGSLEHFIARVAVLQAESTRIEAERDTEAAIARAQAAQVQAQPGPTQPSKGRMDHAAAVKHYEGLVAAGKSIDAGQFWQENRELLRAPGAERAKTREEAEAKYGEFINAGRSYEAGVYYQTNRDLLRPW